MKIPRWLKLEYHRETHVTEVVRFTPEMYRKLEQSVSPIQAPNSAESAAYQLGIQRVLQTVRTGFTIGFTE